MFGARDNRKYLQLVIAMFTESVILPLLVLMPVAAFLYSSVGHGGASSYIMLLTLFHFAPSEVRPFALLLNILVSGVSFLSYRRVCNFPTKLFLHLIIFSVPAAFLGGAVSVDAVLYKKILGVLLIFPALRLFNIISVRKTVLIERKWWMMPIIGLSIGFLSGLIGIGGGIILSPVLLLLGWANVKETAAISALFIFLNSIAGLFGAGITALAFQQQLQLLMPLTLIGGVAGAYFGANKFNVPALKFLLATVLIIAASKFLIA